jgi:hypothetical protein
MEKAINERLLSITNYIHIPKGIKEVKERPIYREPAYINNFVMKTTNN